MLVHWLGIWGLGWVLQGYYTEVQEVVELVQSPTAKHGVHITPQSVFPNVGYAVCYGKNHHSTGQMSTVSEREHLEQHLTFDQRTTGGMTIVWLCTEVGDKVWLDGYKPCEAEGALRAGLLRDSYVTTSWTQSEGNELHCLMSFCTSFTPNTSTTSFLSH